MSMHKLDIKSRLGAVIQFSTSTTAGGAALRFASVNDAAEFLSRHFNDYHYARGLLGVAEGLGIACFTDHQIFNRFHRFKLRHSYSRDQALQLKLVKDLQPGDFISHIDYGIGKFSGLQKIEIDRPLTGYCAIRIVKMRAPSGACA